MRNSNPKGHFHQTIRLASGRCQRSPGGHQQQFCHVPYPVTIMQIITQTWYFQELSFGCSMVNLDTDTNHQITKSTWYEALKVTRESFLHFLLTSISSYFEPS